MDYSDAITIFKETLAITINWSPYFDSLHTLEPHLDSLIGVAHHSNEQVDEHDDRDHQVEGKDHLEHLVGPLPNVVGHLQVLGSGEAEELKTKFCHVVYHLKQSCTTQDL